MMLIGILGWAKFKANMSGITGGRGAKLDDLTPYPAKIRAIQDMIATYGGQVSEYDARIRDIEDQPKEGEQELVRLRADA